MNNLIHINITNATDNPYIFALFVLTSKEIWKQTSLSSHQKWEIDYPRQTALLVSQDIINKPLEDRKNVQTFVQTKDIWQYVESNGFSSLVESDQKNEEGSITLINTTSSTINVFILKDNLAIESMHNVTSGVSAAFTLPNELTLAYAQPETPNDFSDPYRFVLNSPIININLTDNGWKTD